LTNLETFRILKSTVFEYKVARSNTYRDHCVRQDQSCIGAVKTTTVIATGTTTTLRTGTAAATQPATKSTTKTATATNTTT
jgi:hypothetical protein